MAVDFDLSIIVLGHNKKNFTYACLKDLFQLPSNVEVIFVDNGSTDGTHKDCPQTDPHRFLYIFSTENLGFAGGNQLGYQRATGKNIMFLNNDIRVNSNHSNWTDDLLSKLEEDTLIGPTGGFLDEKTFEFKYETNDARKKINYISGWCITATKNTWNKLDLGNGEIFDKLYSPAYFEDSDLSWRAKEQGIKLKLVNVPLTHFGHVTAKDLGINYLYKQSHRKFKQKWMK